VCGQIFSASTAQFLSLCYGKNRYLIVVTFQGLNFDGDLREIFVLSAQQPDQAAIRQLLHRHCMLEGSIKIFAGLFYYVAQYLCLRWSHIDLIVVFVQSTKMLNAVDISYNPMNLWDMKCLCSALNVSVMNRWI